MFQSVTTVLREYFRGSAHFFLELAEFGDELTEEQWGEHHDVREPRQHGR